MSFTADEGKASFECWEADPAIKPPAIPTLRLGAAKPRYLVA
jgi:hypothetical protein